MACALLLFPMVSNVYIAYIQQLLQALWTQARSGEPATHFLFLSSACNIIKQKLFLCSWWRMGGGICVVLMWTQTKKKAFYFHCLARHPLKKGIFFHKELIHATYYNSAAYVARECKMSLSVAGYQAKPSSSGAEDSCLYQDRGILQTINLLL